MTEKTFFRHMRWYEKDPALADAMDIFFSFPDRIQTALAEAVSRMIRSRFRPDRFDTRLRNLGKETVLSLYKSKRLNRSYDRYPAIHQAVNCLFLLGSAERTYMARQMVEMAKVASLYYTHCRSVERDPMLSHVEKLLEFYVNLGPGAAEIMLDAYRKSIKPFQPVGVVVEEEPAEKTPRPVAVMEDRRTRSHRVRMMAREWCKKSQSRPGQYPPETPIPDKLVHFAAEGKIINNV